MMTNRVTEEPIIIKSESIVDYAVFDYYGRFYMKGRLSAGINYIRHNGLKDGAYVVRYSDGLHEWSEKFFKIK